MGCLPYTTSEEARQILETSGILDTGYNPTAQDVQVLENAIGVFGKEAIAKFCETNGALGEYAFKALAALLYSSDLLGSETLINDLSDGQRKFTGGVFELAYAVVHHDEIAGIEMPTFHVAKDMHEYTRPGPDIWMKDNSVVELKSFDFHNNYYITHANQVAEKVADQAARRLKEGAVSVSVVFNERLGEMPEAFRSALNQAIAGNPNINFRSE